MPDFRSFGEQATGGHQPYLCQARSHDRLPGTLRAPTGAGKTGVILARLYGPGCGGDAAQGDLRAAAAVADRTRR